LQLGSLELTQNRMLEKQLLLAAYPLVKYASIAKDRPVSRLNILGTYVTHLLCVSVSIEEVPREHFLQVGVSW
jgi:hypothetical protein